MTPFHIILIAVAIALVGAYAPFLALGFFQALALAAIACLVVFVVVRRLESRAVTVHNHYTEIPGPSPVVKRADQAAETRARAKRLAETERPPVPMPPSKRDPVEIRAAEIREAEARGYARGKDDFFEIERRRMLEQKKGTLRDGE